MRLTKLEHSTLLLTKDDATLVVDPGSFTRSLAGVSNVAGIVVTHEHADHWTPEQLHRLLGDAGDVPVYGPQGVADAMHEADASLVVTVVEPGDNVSVGPFALRFYGGRHAVIHESIPVVDNLGVVVDDTLWYAGDSFASSGDDVQVLAVPSSAPWLKIGEVIDYVLAEKPRRAFLVHEQINSDAGNQMAAARVEWAAQQDGGELIDLAAGDSVEI